MERPTPFELEPLKSDFRLASPPPQPRRKASIKRCMLYTCIAIFVLVSIAIGYGVYSTAKTVIQTLSDPHHSLYYNGTDTPKGSSVVRPLFDKDTKFDIALTVFVKRPNATVVSNIATTDPDGVEESEKHKAALQNTARVLGLSAHAVQGWYEQDILWSGWLAKGMTLDSKPVDMTVKFDLPIETFYEDQLSSMDLRMGVLVVPTSPSRFDRLEDFTFWKGDAFKQAPPYIDSKLLDQVILSGDRANRTAQEEVLKRLVMSANLLEFHHIPDQCNGTNTNTTDFADEDEEDLYSSINVDNDETGKSDESSESKTETEKVTTHHPFVQTRSHFYIVNETRLFDRKAFDAKHNSLIKTACGRGSHPLVPTWRMCYKEFLPNGLWELRLGLLPAETGGKKELAYGPFVSRMKNSAGPKHFQKIPVSRGQCNGTSIDRSNDPKTITIEHTVRFSSLSSGWLRLYEDFVRAERLEHNATHAQIQSSHDLWENHLGLLGDKTEGSRPWTRAFIFITDDMLIALVGGGLHILYWYTRLTSTGIDSTAAYFRGVGDMSTALTSIAYMFSTGVGAGLWAVTFDGLGTLPAILMLRLVWPLEVEEWSVRRMRFRIRRSRWTHRERNSRRLQSHLTLIYRFLLTLACWGVVYFPTKYDYFLVKPRISHAGIPNAAWYFRFKFQSLLAAMQISGLVQQLSFNHISRTFAGDYSLNALLHVAHSLIALVWWTPLIGKYDARESLRYETGLRVLVSLWAGWQAWTLPRVEQDVKDAEDE